MNKLKIILINGSKIKGFTTMKLTSMPLRQAWSLPSILTQITTVM